ncbi:hypothetical protein [Antrihabitans cavernicola]|uniref:DUF5666 domain-containing protein n=1 Tax=Antrihabitans cavernicola TaxID=2495913 RepID=A0A5A7S6Q0_9NOCA|nr:hypothetical protein [Spelaeibacter cavernicola]KAA0018084.1 hypothetical protein FOY51_24425 [Spelaeibacter cavernicola]
MNPTQQQVPPTAEPTWGAPQPPAPNAWSTKKTIAAAGVAAVIAAGGGAAIYAATSGGSNTMGGPGGGFGGPGGGRGMMMGGGATNSLHGEFVVSDGDGGYTTELTQTGTVTAISATSVTAQSADSYSHTYTISGNTSANSLAVGDTASIRATVTNGNATVTQINEGSAAGGGQQGGRQQGGTQQGGMQGGMQGGGMQGGQPPSLPGN